MATVNPPPNFKIPREFLKDKEARSYFQQLQFTVFQLWKRTGGGNDIIDSIEDDITSTESRVSRISARVNSLEKIQFDIEIITADFAAGQNQIIICNNTSNIDVTLNPLAIEEDEVHIKRKAARVNVLGPVDGRTKTIINIKNFSMHLVFDGIEWGQI